MSSFTDDPYVYNRMLGCGRMFEITQPFTFYTKHAPPRADERVKAREDGNYDITVPVGLITDFASTPSILWSVLPPIGRFSKASVVHDYLYIAQIGNRKWADRVFREAMLVSGTSHLAAWVYYRGVRALGWIAWFKHWLKKARAQK